MACCYIGPITRPAGDVTDEMDDYISKAEPMQQLALDIERIDVLLIALSELQYLLALIWRMGAQIRPR